MRPRTAARECGKAEAASGGSPMATRRRDAMLDTDAGHDAR